jgi:hypothetical protein
MLHASAKWLFGDSTAGTRDRGALHDEFPAVIKGFDGAKLFQL